LGIAIGADPKKIEKQIMEILPKKDWDAGMAMSFLGREICRPQNPKHQECPMKDVCAYYKEIRQKK
jgi:endonuclease-3